MAMTFGYAQQAYRGDPVCGDVGIWWEGPHRYVLALADGLGHGAPAHHAASAAMQCIAGHLDASCAAMFAACNERLLDTRGAVLAIAIIDRDSNLLTLGVIGNIRVRVFGVNSAVRLGAGRGFVGAGYALPAPDQLRLDDGDRLVMVTDGVDESDGVRACMERNDETSQQLADDVLQGWANQNDDAAVLVYRHRHRGSVR
ncbi:MAG: SpoIIE family protein phosphatase [Oxalobacteraceae bacterium]|nr:SpoIIE family protein phosphatase [Oxalobacteraceae bacterium]